MYIAEIFINYKNIVFAKSVFLLIWLQIKNDYSKIEICRAFWVCSVLYVVLYNITLWSWNKNNSKNNVDISKIHTFELLVTFLTESLTRFEIAKMFNYSSLLISIKDRDFNQINV